MRRQITTTVGLLLSCTALGLWLFCALDTSFTSVIRFLAGCIPFWSCLATAAFWTAALRADRVFRLHSAHQCRHGVESQTPLLHARHPSSLADSDYSAAASELPPSVSDAASYRMSSFGTSGSSSTANEFSSDGTARVCYCDQTLQFDLPQPTDLQRANVHADVLFFIAFSMCALVWRTKWPWMDLCFKGNNNHMVAWTARLCTLGSQAYLWIDSIWYHHRSRSGFWADPIAVTLSSCFVVLLQQLTQPCATGQMDQPTRTPLQLTSFILWDCLLTTAGIAVLSLLLARLLTIYSLLARHLLDRSSSAAQGLISIELGIPYQPGAHDSRQPRCLDVYSPTRHSAGGQPVVVLVHGGMLMWGSRHYMAGVAVALAKRSCVCVVPDYGLWPSSRLPSPVHHIAEVIAWTKANAARFGGDSRRISVCGHSAGALLAALCVLDAESYLNPLGVTASDITGLCLVSGGSPRIPRFAFCPAFCCFSVEDRELLSLRRLLRLRSQTDAEGIPYRTLLVTAQHEGPTQQRIVDWFWSAASHAYGPGNALQDMCQRCVIPSETHTSIVMARQPSPHTHDCDYAACHCSLSDCIARWVTKGL